MYVAVVSVPSLRVIADNVIVCPVTESSSNREELVYGSDEESEVVAVAVAVVTELSVVAVDVVIVSVYVQLSTVAVNELVAEADDCDVVVIVLAVELT